MILLADALFNASTKINNSIKFSFTGSEVDCTTNTSLPLTVSSILTNTSPSLNLTTSAFPKGSPYFSAIFLAKSLFEVPAKIFTFSELIIFYFLQSVLIICLLLDTANELLGTSFVITEPAPTRAFSPIFTGATSIVSLPINTSLPITVLNLFTPS